MRVSITELMRALPQGIKTKDVCFELSVRTWWKPRSRRMRDMFARVKKGLEQEKSPGKKATDLTQRIERVSRADSKVYVHRSREAIKMARSEQMAASQFDQMVNHESGLFGISEIGSDMRDLLAQEAVELRAAEAVAPCSNS